MPADRIFIDSNVLLYGRDKALDEKAQITNTWLRFAVGHGMACANLQVLNEVANVMLRKRTDLTPTAIFATVDELSFLGRKPINDQIVSRGRQVRLKTDYSWWDCLLIASALELGCRWFLSEDLQDGREIDGLTIVDPFAHSPEQILLPR